jgi:hypothetical protein
MHSRTSATAKWHCLRGFPVGTLQVFELPKCLRIVCGAWRYGWLGWPATCYWPVSLTHRFIHTTLTVLEECCKKNHLALNSELDVMIQKTTSCLAARASRCERDAKSS